MDHGLPLQQVAHAFLVMAGWLLVLAWGGSLLAILGKWAWELVAWLRKRRRHAAGPFSRR